MPAAPDPERMETLAEVFAGMDNPEANFWSKDKAIDLRHVEGAIYIRPGRQLAARQSVWLKAIGTLPDDPLVAAFDAAGRPILQLPDDSLLAVAMAPVVETVLAAAFGAMALRLARRFGMLQDPDARRCCG